MDRLTAKKKKNGFFKKKNFQFSSHSKAEETFYKHKFTDRDLTLGKFAAQNMRFAKSHRIKESQSNGRSFDCFTYLLFSVTPFLYVHTDIFSSFRRSVLRIINWYKLIRWQWVAYSAQTHTHTHFLADMHTKLRCVGVERGLKTVFSMKSVSLLTQPKKPWTHKCHCANVLCARFSAFECGSFSEDFLIVSSIFFFFVDLVVVVACGLSVCMFFAFVCAVRAPSDTFVLYAMIICASSDQVIY